MAALLFGVVAAIASSCLAPTEITVQITSDDCAALTKTRIARESGDFVASQDGCESPGVVGSIVFLPSHSPSDRIDFEIVGGLGKDPASCVHADPQCIVARRSL